MASSQSASTSSSSHPLDVGVRYRDIADGGDVERDDSIETQLENGLLPTEEDWRAQRASQREYARAHAGMQLPPLVAPDPDGDDEFGAGLDGELFPVDDDEAAPSADPHHDEHASGSLRGAHLTRAEFLAERARQIRESTGYAADPVTGMTLGDGEPSHE